MEKKYIEWIGTGSGLNPVLGNTSFMIKGIDRIVLVDCGSTVPLELMKSSELKDVTDVIITHSHSDHAGGLEMFGFMNYYALKRRKDNRPNLYLSSDEFADKLWNNSLKGGMSFANDNGNHIEASLDSYFKVNKGKKIKIADFPEINLFETPHIKNLENYGVMIGKDIYYSGDTLALPPSEPRLIFQDCQFYESKEDAHISYDKLKRELSPEVKAKTYLVHLSMNQNNKCPKSDGFAGFVNPGDKFEIL